MPFLTLVETPEDNRGRFVSDTTEEAIQELSRRFNVGTTVAEKLRRGDVIATESYRLQIVPLETAPPKRQQKLFE
jgi:hypothetical protein